LASRSPFRVSTRKFVALVKRWIKRQQAASSRFALRMDLREMFAAERRLAQENLAYETD
jgi:hypothetical protein